MPLVNSENTKLHVPMINRSLLVYETVCRQAFYDIFRNYHVTDIIKTRAFPDCLASGRML